VLISRNGVLQVSLRPDKFTGKDWSLWKEQMQAVSTLESLWEIVDGFFTPT